MRGAWWLLSAGAIEIEFGWSNSGNRTLEIFMFRASSPHCFWNWREWSGILETMLVLLSYGMGTPLVEDGGWRTEVGRWKVEVELGVG